MPLYYAVGFIEKDQNLRRGFLFYNSSVTYSKYVCVHVCVFVFVCGS